MRAVWNCSRPKWRRNVKSAVLRHRREKVLLSQKVANDRAEGTLQFAFGNWSVITRRETAHDICVSNFAMEIALQ